MAFKQEVVEFERVFGQAVDSFLNRDKELDFCRNCETKERLKALIQLLESSYTIPGWRGILTLGGNGIGAAEVKDLATMLEKNTTIHTLDLRSNQIGAAGVKDLATMLEKNTTIHTLNLSDNDIGAAGAKDLANMLEANTTVHTLNLCRNRFGPAGAKDLTAMLEKNTTIHTLNLLGIGLGAAGAKDLATRLDKNTTVHTLVLANNAIGAAGVKDLATMLAKNSTVRTLDLRGNDIGAAGAKDLATMVGKNTTIHTLNLRGNGIGAAGAKDLATMLAKNTTIHTLNLGTNDIKAAGAKDLTTMLEKNSTIHTLYLGGNDIGAAGAKDLATMLANNTTIHTLNLSDNDVGAAGAGVLATMVAKNTTIHTLYLGSNAIGAAGVKDLATILEKNATIRTLYLGGNDIGVVGAKDLATMLEKNTTVHTLDLGWNDIEDAGAKDLATMLEKNTTIHTLNLHDNRIGVDGAKDLEQMLGKNVTIQNIVLREKELSQSMENALARNKDGIAALQHAVDIKHSQAIESLLEKYHENLDIKKELVVRIWKIVKQNNPKETTLKILMDLAIQSDASDLFPELLPHVDEAVVAQLLSHHGEAALSQLFPHLDDATLAQLQFDPRPEITNVVEIALTSVDSSFNPSRLAQQLTALLALPTDVFDEDGAPLPSIFLERASTSTSKRRIDLVAAAVRCFLERQHKHEIKTWLDVHPDANTLMTGLDVTKSAERHLERYADTPLDLQQTNPSVDHMVVPEWYEQVLVQPAVEVVRNQLEQRRVAALADTTQTDTCQQLAKESLDADRQLYSGALSKAQQQNRAATNKMELLAAQKQLQIQGTWPTHPDTGKPQRPTHPNMPASATVAQVKLQAVQQGGAFRKVIESIRVATGLTVSMVKGSVDRDSGLLRKHKGDDDIDNQESSLYMSKGGYRIAQKLWVRGDVQSICDINRALFVADTFEDLFKAAEHIFSRSDIRIVDIKDRVNSPTYGGWSDLVLLFSVEGTIGHIHELQLALKPMMIARGAMAAHEAYARARYFVEMLQKCDLQYDFESLESKLQKINEKLGNVINDQKQQIADQKQQNEDQKQQNEDLKRPGRTLCGWLQQAEGEKKKWKRRWFVLSNGWLTYHDNNKVKSSLSTWERLKIAKGATPMFSCSIFVDKDSNEEHKLEIINETEGTYLHLDKSNKPEPPGEMYTRTEWVDAMLTHTGCKIR